MARSAFKLRSQGSSFKMMGSSPMRKDEKYTEEQQDAINQGKLANWNKANPKASQDEMNAEQSRIWNASKTTITEETEAPPIKNIGKYPKPSY